MVLSQQQRLLNMETNFINASTTAPNTLSGVDYGTLTVPAGGALFVFRFLITQASGDVANPYMTMNGKVYYSTYLIDADAGSISEHKGLVYLAAGTYNNVTFYATSGVGKITSISAGLVYFRDLTYTAESRTTSAGAITTKSITCVAPAARKTPIGTTAKSTLFVYVYAYRTGMATSVGFNNASDTNSMYLDLYVDGVRADWTGGALRYGKMQMYGGDYGGIAWVTLTVDPESSHTIEVRAHDAIAYPYSEIMMSAVNCPWILSDDATFPIQTLSVTQESTVYVTAEPLFSDPATKTVRVGKVRCGSFGAATDYYESLDGTGILEFEYKFTAVKPNTVGIIQAFGLGGCISYVGVDLA